MYFVKYLNIVLQIIVNIVVKMVIILNHADMVNLSNVLIVGNMATKKSSAICTFNRKMAKKETGVFSWWMDSCISKEEVTDKSQ